MINNKLIKLSTFAGIAFVIVACSTASTIQRADKSKSAFEGAVYEGERHTVNGDIDGAVQYRIYHEASTGFTSIESVRISATKRADDFCTKKGKVMQVISEHTSTPPHIFGNFPRIEIIFSCTNKSSPLDVKNDKYENLRKLKLLLDDGVITKEEYNAEKKKVLSK